MIASDPDVHLLLFSHPHNETSVKVGIFLIETFAPHINILTSHRKKPEVYYICSSN